MNTRRGRTALGLLEEITAALIQEHYRRADDRIIASPEEHQADFASVVMAVVDPELDRLEDIADQYERLRKALFDLMTPSQRAGFRGRKMGDDNAAIIEFVGELVTDRQNLQQAIDTSLEDLRKVVYDLGNA